MAPGYWVMPEQLTWLNTWMAEFIKRQAEGKLNLFWLPMTESWFNRFPEQANVGLPLPSNKDKRKLTDDETKALGKAIKTRHGQLENWFHNNIKKVGKANRAEAASASNVFIQRMFKQNAPKRGRAHQPIELFQKHNAKLIKTAMATALAAVAEQQSSSSDVDGDDSETTAKKRKASKKAERMRAIEEEVEGEKKLLCERELAAELQSEAQEKAPADLQEGIDVLDAVYSNLHKATYATSRWVGMSIFDGPNPRMNGDLTMKIVCFGESPQGNDFEHCCIDFKKNITQPFQDFLRLVFSTQDCTTAALPKINMVFDERPVDCVVVSVSAPAETVIKPSKKAKSKSKSKSKSKNKSPATVEEPSPTTPPADSDVMDKMEDDSAFGKSVKQEKYEQLFGGEDANSADLGEPSDAQAYEGPSVQLVKGEDSADLGEPVEPVDVPADEGRSLPWPAGMGPPLSPATAGAITAIERGGTENPTTMAIDQLLLRRRTFQSRDNQTTSPSLAGRLGSPCTFAAIPGETFDHWQARHPLDIRLPRVLLPPGTALDTPPISNPAHLPPNSPPPVPTVAARVLQGLLAVYMPTAPVAPLPATPVVQPVVQQPVVTSPVSLPMSAPITPHVAMPVPSSPPPITPPPLVLPRSRPPMNPIPPPKKVPARKAPAKKPSTAQTAIKKTAAVSAAKVAAVRSPKKRGRPWRESLPNITNTMVDAASASMSETAAATSDPPIPPHAAAEAEAMKAAEEAGVCAKKLAKGWVEAMVDGATVVTLLPAKRVRKLAMLPDGSRLQPKTTEPKLDASEKALLAHAAANSKKRKTSTTHRAKRVCYRQKVRTLSCNITVPNPLFLPGVELRVRLMQ
ncbi:hypothetical protein B0H14DRAFT_3462309 [Mycena olivaceomarginata]|nr:hypothetical protein B0H14DRAFT_3462309 [Mycena olivaceomarginata]